VSTLQQVREGLHEAWDTLQEGWQRLYRRAAGAITRFNPGSRAKDQQDPQHARELAARSSGWGVLAVEVYDDDQKVVVRLEAPGMDKDDFDLQLVEDYLVVSGEKQLTRERTEGRYHLTECAYGRFERAIPLPEKVDAGKANATYREGVLRVELPKLAVRERKTIPVQVA